MNPNLTSWNPFNEIAELKRLAEAVGIGLSFDYSKKTFLSRSQWSPRIDITEDAEGFLVKAELPEMAENDIRVVVAGGTLTISGERRFKKEKIDFTYHRIESEHGTFVRSFALPAGASGENISAELRDGVLRVRLPKDPSFAAHVASAQREFYQPTF